MRLVLDLELQLQDSYGHGEVTTMTTGPARGFTLAAGTNETDQPEAFSLLAFPSLLH